MRGGNYYGFILPSLRTRLWQKFIYFSIHYLLNNILKTMTLYILNIDKEPNTH